MDGLFSALVSIGLIVAAVWGGTRLIQRGVPGKGATGTLGSVLSMIDPATGAPTKQESAAAAEELRQHRHERYAAGPRTPGIDSARSDPGDARI